MQDNMLQIVIESMYFLFFSIFCLFFSFVFINSFSIANYPPYIAGIPIIIDLVMILYEGGGGGLP